MSYFQSVDSLILTGATVAIALATVVLVVVTWRYAKATAEIVEEMRKDRVETQKDRRVLYIERQLEKLYYPIRNIEFDLPNSRLPDSLDKLKEVLDNPFWDYQYLGEEQLKKKLAVFRELCERGSPEEFKGCYQEILEITNQEIFKLTEELNDLTK